MSEKCQHVNWRINGSDRLGFGTCADCLSMVGLDELINGSIERLEEATRKANLIILKGKLGGQKD